MLVGFVDLVARDQISGWAADLDHPDDPRAIVVLIDGREVGRTTADRLRIDLRSLGKYGDGRHGFVFQFEPPLDPACDHDILVRFADAPVALTRGAFRIARDAAAVRPTATDPPAASATARPRYIVHVGLPKTGTKYLQSVFWHHRQQLRSAGVDYPSEWWASDPLFAHHELARELSEGPSGRLAEIFARLNDGGSPIVLLSCEGFVSVPERGLEYLRELTRGARIEIVFFARRWSDWLPSQWQQAVKQGSLQTFPEWYALLLSVAENHPGIDQAIFLDRFAEIFGRSAIRLVSYSNLIDRDVDLVPFFCERILGLGPWFNLDHKRRMVHESMGILVTELIRCLNARQAIAAGQPGYHVFQAFAQVRNEPAIAGDLKWLFATMERNVGELTIDDSAVFLQTIYARINGYRDLLVGTEYGEAVFERRHRPCRFVRPDFLMVDGVGDAIGRISDAVQAKLGPNPGAAAG